MKKSIKRTLLTAFIFAVGLCLIVPQSIFAQGWSCFGNGSKIFKCKAGGEAEVVYGDGGQHACFSTDGKLIFFNKGGDIWAVKHNGEDARKIGTHSTGSGARFCAYRPEPQTVLVVDGQDWHKINANTKEKTLVFKGGRSVYGEIGISTDGTRVAARQGDNNLHKGVITGTSVSWSKYAGFCSASISPDGQSLTENGSAHTDMKVYAWGGGSQTYKNTAGGTWDNQRFSVNSDDWISVLFDNSVGANKGVGVGAHQISTNKTTYVGVVPNGDTQYPDFWVGELPSDDVSVPELAMPDPGGTDQELSLSLKWSPVQNATKYHAQVATDEAFTQIVFEKDDVTTNETAVADLTAGTTYYWRVKAGNAINWGEFSSAWNFTTKGGAFIIHQVGRELPSQAGLDLGKDMSLTLSLPVSGAVQLSLFSPDGQRIELVKNKQLAEGIYKLETSGLDFGCGVWLYRLQAGPLATTGRLLLTY